MSDCLYIHDPDAKLDYSHDWSSYLQAGETIASSTWNLTPASTAATLSGMSISSTTSVTAVIVTGLSTVGSIYRLVNRITTSSTRTDDRTIVLRVEHE